MTITSWFMIPSKLRKVMGEPIVERYEAGVGRRSYWTALAVGEFPRAFFYQDGGKPEGAEALGPHLILSH